MPSEFWKDIIGHKQIVDLLNKWVDGPAFSYIFYGPQHLGKSLIAEKFVRALVDYPEVEDLQLHPDVVLFLPEEGKRDVSVDVVRKNRIRLQERPQLSKRVVGFLPKLDRLNEAGFNALLKVMEEPPADAVFVSVAESISQVPATILSRSVCVPLSLVPRQIINQALVERGMDNDRACLLSEKSRGKPGLALGEQDELEVFQMAVELFVKGPGTGHRMAAVDQIREICESSEDPLSAWTNALEACSIGVNKAWSQNPKEGLILAQGIADALACVGGSVSPHLLLYACATKATLHHLTMPGLFPRYFPLTLED